MVLLVQEMQNVVVLVVKDNLLMVQQAQKLEQVEAVQAQLQVVVGEQLLLEQVAQVALQMQMVLLVKTDKQEMGQVQVVQVVVQEQQQTTMEIQGQEIRICYHGHK